MSTNEKYEKPKTLVFLVEFKHGFLAGSTENNCENEQFLRDEEGGVWF